MMPPYALKAQDLGIRRQDGGIRITFSSEKDELRCPEELERALGFAFAGHDIQLSTEPRGSHYVFIRGLNNTGRAQSLLNVLHLIHTDGAECPDIGLALDWHKIPEGEGWARTEVGDLVNRAKHNNDDNSRVEIGNILTTIVQYHGTIRGTNYIISPPSSSSLANTLAKIIGDRLRVPVLKSTREQAVRKQSDDKDMDPEELCERQRDTIAVSESKIVGSVLIVDDVYGSGGTIRELTRQLRARGAERIFAVTATKRRRHHRQT